MKARETTLLAMAAVLLGGASWLGRAPGGAPRSSERDGGVIIATPAAATCDQSVPRFPVATPCSDATLVDEQASVADERRLRIEVRDRAGVPIAGADVTLAARGLLLRSATNGKGVVSFPADRLQAGSVRVARSGVTRHVAFDVPQVRAGALAIELAP